MKSSIILLIIGLLLTIPATAVEPPDDIGIELEKDVYAEGELLEGTIYLNISESFAGNTEISLELEDIRNTRRLTDIFDDIGMSYEKEPSTSIATNPQPSKTISFSKAGRQYFYINLPKNADVDTLDLAIYGKKYQNKYPEYVTMDVGDDGTNEWSYQGVFTEYGDFILPTGLKEHQESGSVFLTDDVTLYCELVNLPNAKDFTINAKYRYGPNQNGDLHAVLLSSVGSGDFIDAQGGADTCDLPEPTQGLDYYSCQISTDSFISGERLLCIYNNNRGNTGDTFYELAKDTDRGVGYHCDALSRGTTECEQQIVDFFIKAQTGKYTGELIEQVDFNNGRTEFIFEHALTDYLSDCSPMNDFCAIPITMTTASAGNIFMTTLDIRYESGGSDFSESNIYSGSTIGGGIIDLDGVDLTTGVTFELDFPVDTLNFFIPNIDEEDNYTLELEVDPGPTTYEDISIIKSSIVAQEDLSTIIITYKDLLNKIVTSSSDLLDALDYKIRVTSAIANLDTYRSEYMGLNQSNLSQEEKQDKINEIKDNLAQLINILPRNAYVTTRVTDSIVIGYDSITDDVVLPGQTDTESKNKVYQYQNKFTIQGKAELYRLKFFDDSINTGTLITKTISGSMGDSYIVELIPNYIIQDIDDIEFSVEPDIIKQSNPIIVRWPSSTGTTITYVTSEDITPGLQDLKTIIVPKRLQDIGEARQPSLAQCGNGVCEYLEVDGKKIPLEDRYTCPQDCTSDYSIMPFIIGLVLVGIGIYYFHFYHGKYNFHELTHGEHKPKVKKPFHFKRKLILEKSPFISKKDESNLRLYAENTLKKGFSKDKITKVLLQKGWTREQIDYIFHKK